MAVCAVYVNDFYRADTEAIAAFGEDKLKIKILDDGTYVFEPEESVAGFIFYPGGKVEYKAYIPLMQACAEKGITCVLTDMPFNLAVLDINRADGIAKEFPEIESWYIGGHSLGGAMAAQYVSENPDDFDGLVLLGAYSPADLSDTDLKVLSLYGSEDMVMDREKYKEGKANLPKDFKEAVIDGGCHAYFGMYGPQDGDGTPEIRCEEQIEITAEEIFDLLISEEDKDE